MATARQRLGKHIPVPANTHVTEDMMEVVFLMWYMTKLRGPAIYLTQPRTVTGHTQLHDSQSCDRRTRS
jgi:hypothetical protein